MPTDTSGSCGAPDLALIVGAARSGTTLLRLMLDNHPEIGCPAEAGIPSLISTLGRVWWTIDADQTRSGTGDPPALKEERLQPLGNDQLALMGAPPELPPKARDETQRAALAVMRHYCERNGKHVYCDKSLDSVYHLEAVRQTFPDARYVLLFRHVMDTVASGIEASPWGFHAYGYLPFVQHSPDNLVAALVNYWLTHVDGALRWEDSHPELCHRIRYEDLVTAPEEVLVRLFGFLGVGTDVSVLETAFEKAAAAGGPGDYKVTFTSNVDARSIGHGKRVPVGMIPPPLLDRLNATLTVLGYEPLMKTWNAEPLARAGGGGAWGARLADLMRNSHPRALTDGNGAMGSFAVVAEDAADLRWVIEASGGTIRQGEGEVESVVTGTAEDLALLLSGEVNPGVLLRSGRIRHLTARDDLSPEELTGDIRSILDVLMDGRVRVNGSQSTGAAP